MRIGIDMGHTLSGNGTGAQGYVKESDKNREAGKRLIQMLQENKHTVVNCTVDKSSNDLVDRVRKANAQPLDLFLSIHLNAFKKTSSEMGVETFTYRGSSKAKETAKDIQAALVANIGWKNRGVKEANYHVLRETKAPAVLVELGFCDSKGDMDKWDTEKIAAALFKGITGSEYKAPVKPSVEGVMYRVVCGSYSDRDNAEAQQAKLEKAGFKSFLDAFKKDGKTFLRVVCGSYSEKDNAVKAVNKLESKGFEPFIAVYKTEEEKEKAPVAPAKPEPPKKPVVSCDKEVRRYPERGMCTITTKSGIKFRNKPCTCHGEVQGTYSFRQRVNYDLVVITEDYVWISWIGGSKKERRYMPIKDRKTNERWGTCV